MPTPCDASPNLDRRDLLKGAASAGLASALAPWAEVLGAAPSRQADLIRAENERPGTTDWLLKNTRVDPKTKFRCPWIEGYCSHTSIRPADNLAIMGSTSPTTT